MVPECRAGLRGEEMPYEEGSQAPKLSKPLVFTVLASHAGPDVRFRFGRDHFGPDVACHCCPWPQSELRTYAHGPRAVRY